MRFFCKKREPSADMLYPAWWIITGYYQISLSHDFVEQADRYTDKQNDLSVSHAT